MNHQFRSELFKQRTTPSSLWLMISAVALITAVVLLHVLSLPAAGLANADGQLKIFGMGTTFGALFASLLGAISITGEIRHGLIRPTFLITPRRGRVLAAKAAASALAGAVIGLLTETVGVMAGSAGLAARGITLTPTAGDLTRLILGGAVAAALWAVIGSGIGAIVRSQVGALIGLTVWQLFIEQTLIGILPDAARYAPGASAGSLAGAILQQTSTSLLPPAAGALVAIGYATAATAAGAITIARRDVT